MGFLESEQNLLVRFVESAGSLMREPGRESANEETVALGEELDYLTLDFPDRQLRPPADKGFYARSLASAHHYLGEVRRACSMAAVSRQT